MTLQIGVIRATRGMIVFKLFQMGLIGLLLGLAVTAQAQVRSGELFGSGAAMTGAGLVTQIRFLLSPAE